MTGEPNKTHLQSVGLKSLDVMHILPTWTAGLCVHDRPARGFLLRKDT